MLKDSGAGSRQRFIETTLALIAEEGGSLDVNLRQISRRMGCAHTNAYNYFESYGDLLWAAFRQALRNYGEGLIEGLDVTLPPAEYLRRCVANLAAFPRDNPGLYRFIGSDPIDLSTIPSDILEMVTAMKRWFVTVVEAAAGPRLASAEAREAADIVLAYIDGETLNLINGRAIPSEDLAGRILTNALRLFELLVRDARGAPGTAGRRPSTPPDPALIFGG
jgi:AcrR family transcriptional regulator